MVQNAIFLNDVAVSNDNLLGSPGSGLDVAQDAMMFARLGLGATAVGGMKRCAQLMSRYAQRRSISTGRLMDNPVTLASFSDLIGSIAAVEAVVRAAAEFLDEGVQVPDEVFVTCKISATEYLWRAADNLMQLLGGRGYMENNMAAQILRDARVFRIFEGPTETLQTFLGASVLHGGSNLFTFLRDRIRAENIVQRLHDAAEQIRTLHAEGSTAFKDRVAMLSWVHFQVGRVACAAILLAFIRHAAAHSGASVHAVAWADAELDRAIAAATERNSNSPVLKAMEVTDMLTSYAHTVGDVDQASAGEDDAIYWLLRPDIAVAVRKPAPLLVSAPTIDTARSPSGHSGSSVVHSGAGSTVRDRQQEIENWIRQWLIGELKVQPNTVHGDKAFADFGLDSTTAIMLIADLEEFIGEEFETTLAWDFPTIASLAAFVASRSPTTGHLNAGQSALPPQ